MFALDVCLQPVESDDEDLQNDPTPRWFTNPVRDVGVLLGMGKRNEVSNQHLGNIYVRGEAKERLHDSGCWPEKQCQVE
jgi:hypothetical protein